MPGAHLVVPDHLVPCVNIIVIVINSNHRLSSLLWWLSADGCRPLVVILRITRLIVFHCCWSRCMYYLVNRLVE